MASSISGTFQVGSGFTTPTAAPRLTVSLSSSDALTCSWTSVAGGQTYELQQTDQAGNQVSLFAGGVTLINGTGTEEKDAQGVYGFFTSGTSCVLQLPPGFNGLLRVRAIDGAVPSAPAGPWSNPVAAQAPAGAPNIVFSVTNVRFGAVTTSYFNGQTPYQQVAVTCDITATNTGTAPGLVAAMWAAVVPQFATRSNDVLAGGDIWYSGVELAPGQSITVKGAVSGSASSGPGFQLPVNLQQAIGLAAQAPAFTLHVAMSVQPPYYYQNTDRDYAYQANQTFSPVPGDQAFGPYTYSG